MKKYFLALIFALLSVTLNAQAQLETKKFKISDICERTMDIVLTGNDAVDAVFREGMPNVWNISPYEFCTREQFESRKKSKEYYFLMITDPAAGKHEDNGIRNLTVFKGDPSAGSGTDGLYRITTVPFCSAEGCGALGLAFLPALVDILQQQILSILDKEFNIGDMVRVKALNSIAVWPKPVLVSDSYMTAPPDDRMKGKNLVVAKEEDVIDVMRSADERYLAGYCVAPSVLSKDAVCFTMVIDAQTHELYYLRRRKIGASSPAGFVKADTDAILSHRKR